MLAEKINEVMFAEDFTGYIGEFIDTNQWDMLTPQNRKFLGELYSVSEKWLTNRTDQTFGEVLSEKFSDKDFSDSFSDINKYRHNLSNSFNEFLDNIMPIVEFISLKEKDKLTPTEINSLIQYYQLHKNNLEEDFLNRHNDDKLTRQEEGYILKDTVDQMLKDGLNDNLINIISKKLIPEHKMVQKEYDSSKTQFDLQKYLKSDEAKRIRQTGLTARERVTKAVR